MYAHILPKLYPQLYTDMYSNRVVLSAANIANKVLEVEFLDRKLFVSCKYGPYADGVCAVF